MADARELAQQHDFDLILTDVHLGEEDGLVLLRELRDEGFSGVIVVMTGFGSIEHAVQAMRDGADDYLQKPLSLEELKIQIPKWLELRRMSRRLQLYERLEATHEGARRILGESEAWKRTLGLASRLAQMPIGEGGAGGALPTILLLGETGVGKGVLARYIHDQATAGSKDDPPFVHVNCSALPATLVEGELFGHEKGAFTDARDARAGLFEMAEGGTIFLDEISEMPLELQAKLLVVVEQGTFRRVGGSRERTVRARVIAASNQDLAARSEEGRFRRDLYFRLSAFPIEIPALRAREGDALVIARELLKDFRVRYRRERLRFSEACEEAIASHGWPGNVRELVNAVQRAAMLCSGDTIEPADLGLGSGPITQDGATVNGRARAISTGLRFDFENGPHQADEVERMLMVQALEYTKGNVSKAAKLIGMQRSSFRYRIERYGLEDKVRQIAESRS